MIACSPWIQSIGITRTLDDYLSDADDKPADRELKLHFAPAELFDPKPCDLPFLYDFSAGDIV